ncbi:hypothetical protein WT58_23935 [Burkholderia territorii]|nr:hypothetical protein WT58_23935 [Burkholderia territorii]
MKLFNHLVTALTFESDFSECGSNFKPIVVTLYIRILVRLESSRIHRAAHWRTGLFLLLSSDAKCLEDRLGTFSRQSIHFFDAQSHICCRFKVFFFSLLTKLLSQFLDDCLLVCFGLLFCFILRQSAVD